MVVKDIGGIVIDAVHEVFETLIFILPEESPPEDTDVSRLTGELISSIHISGDINGIVSMVCSRKVAEMLTGNMLGTEGGEVSQEEINDCAGEIVNMVTGNIKSRFVEAGLNFLLSIPTVVSGMDLVLSFPEEVHGVRVTFLVEGEEVRFNFLYKASPALME
ncbi:MAG: chemotaxis protein CheX [Deltaproteobacteria bacterium]|nr:chemotaxis protein CheX [Deltaproteobacteria bacterium]